MILRWPRLSLQAASSVMWPEICQLPGERSLMHQRQVLSGVQDLHGDTLIHRVASCWQLMSALLQAKTPLSYCKVTWSSISLVTQKRHSRGSEPFFMSERGRRGRCSHPLGPNRRDPLKVTHSTDHSPHRAGELCSGNLDIGGFTGYLVHNNGQMTVFPPGYNRGASLSPTRSKSPKPTCMLP